MTQEVELVLAAQTLPPDTPLPERIDAAAAAGVAGLGLRPRDVRAARAAGFSDADVRARLDAAGVRIVELEALRDWGVANAARAREVEQSLYELADALGADYLIAVGEIEGDVDAIADRFAGMCARAAEHGLRVALEFVPFTSIPDVRTAWDVVSASGAGNGGLLVDSWHWYRGTPDAGLLATIPPEHIVGVQLDDADASVRGSSLLEDTLHHRRLPGQGSFDLDAFITLLRDRGVRRWSIEVMSDELHARSAHEVARVAADATRAVLAGAAA